MQFMAEMFMNCSNLVVEGNEKMKYTAITLDPEISEWDNLAV